MMCVGMTMMVIVDIEGKSKCEKEDCSANQCRWLIPNQSAVYTGAFQKGSLSHLSKNFVRFYMISYGFV